MQGREDIIHDNLVRTVNTLMDGVSYGTLACIGTLGGISSKTGLGNGLQHLLSEINYCMSYASWQDNGSWVQK